MDMNVTQTYNYIQYMSIKSHDTAQYLLSSFISMDTAVVQQ